MPESVALPLASHGERLPEVNFSARKLAGFARSGSAEPSSPAFWT